MTREGYRWQIRPWRPTDIQARILDGICAGLTNAEIAARVGITIDGVKWHISRAFSETGVEDRHSLARWWQSEAMRTSLSDFVQPVALGFDATALPTYALFDASISAHPELVEGYRGEAGLLLPSPLPVLKAATPAG